MKKVALAVLLGLLFLGCRGDGQIPLIFHDPELSIEYLYDNGSSVRYIININMHPSSGYAGYVDDARTTYEYELLPWVYLNGMPANDVPLTITSLGEHSGSRAVTFYYMDIDYSGLTSGTTYTITIEMKVTAEFLEYHIDSYRVFEQIDFTVP